MKSIEAAASRFVEVFRASPGFGPFTGAQALSYLHVQMWYVALGFLTIQFTKDPLWMGVIATAGYLPTLFASTPAGWAIDKTSPTHVMIFCGLMRACICLGLGYAGHVGALSLPWVAAGAFGLGVFRSGSVVGRRTLIPRLVSKASVPTANTVDETNSGVTEIIGGILAGLCIAAFGVFNTLLIEGALLLAFAMLLNRVHERRKAPRKKPASVSMREGFAFFFGEGRENKVLLAGLVLSVLVFASCMMFLGLQVFYFGSVLNLDSKTVGTMISLMCAIGLFGPLAVESAIRRYGFKASLATSCVCLAAGLALVAGFDSVSLLVIGGGVIVAAGKGFRVLIVTLCQWRAPERVLGRVLGVFGTFAEGATPFAIMLASAVAKVIGFPGAFALAALVGGVSCVLCFVTPLRTLETTNAPEEALTASSAAG